MRILRTLFFISCASLIQVTYALDPVVSPTPILTNYSQQTPGDTIANIISYFILLTGIISVLAVTYGGIQMILAIGEDEKIKKARHTIIYAFVGLIIAGLAYGVVTFIMNFQLG